MTCIDTSRNPRIPILMEMVGALSRARTPREVLRDFSRGLAQLQDLGGYVSLSVRGLEPGAYRITRMITEEGSIEAVERTDTWSNPQSIPVHRGGFFGHIIRQAYPEVIHHLDLRDDPVVGDALAGFGSLMAIPLFDDGEPLNWAITLRREPEAFTVEELEDTILRSNLVGSTVRNVLTAQRLREANDEVRHEVEQIARIQKALLPQELPDIDGVAIGASYETFDRAGGDYYDFIHLPCRCDEGNPTRDCWGVVIADASGHGPAAAVVMAMLHAILEAYPTQPTGPAEVLEHANRHLFSKRIEHSFVTAFMGIYEPATRRFTYARAGHNPPVHMHRAKDGWRMDRLEAVGGIPLGVMDDVRYDEETIELAKGQTLVLYTDGITESFAPDGSMFGVEGIERSLTDCSGEPDCVIGHVTGALLEHEGGRRPSDDQTIVVMRMV
jgi:sigma-B regulation protein RsbU (phosphoserine phosphatase)